MCCNYAQLSKMFYRVHYGFARYFIFNSLFGTFLYKYKVNHKLNNKLNIPVSYIFFFTGMMLLPFFGFSQQEEPKRVSVVVVASEIAGSKEIVQLPATNLPLTISRRYKRNIPTKRTSRETSNNSTARPSIKEVAMVKTQPKVTIPQKPKAVVKATVVAAETKVKSQAFAAKKSTNIITQPTPVSKATSVAKTPVFSNNAKDKTQEVIAKSAADVGSKPASLSKSKVVVTAPVLSKEQSNSQSTSEANANPATPVKRNEVESDKVADEYVAERMITEELNQEAQAKYSAKVNAVSYIWIGAFLILAGVVLGLLFGKPAFLVSLAGVVFVILSFLV